MRRRHRTRRPMADRDRVEIETGYVVPEARQRPGDHHAGPAADVEDPDRSRRAVGRLALAQPRGDELETLAMAVDVLAARRMRGAALPGAGRRRRVDVTGGPGSR